LGLALGRASQIWKVWILGSLVYSVSLFVPISVTSRLITAPIVGGLVILIYGTFTMKVTTNSR
jgi:hypothetical protein